MSKASDYWLKRAEANMDVLQAAADDRLRLIGRIMNQAQQQLAKDAQHIFRTFAGRFNLTDAEAQAALSEQISAAELSLLKAKVASLPPGTERLAAEIRINSGAYASRISRIEALKQNIAIETTKVSRVLEEELTEQLKFTAVDAYGRTTYDLQVRSNSAFSVPDIRGLKISINSPWAGASFSSRIWGANETLATDLQEIITSGYLGGQSNASVAQQIAKRFGVQFREAERLVRTETNYIAGQSSKAAYIDAGVETYRYKTAWDDRTCKFCAPLDGQIFKVSEALVGVNYPPIHPNCRCTTGASGIIEPAEWKVRRSPDGTVVQIPGDMHFEEWSKWQEAGAPVDIKAWRSAA